MTSPAYRARGHGLKGRGSALPPALRCLAPVRFLAEVGSALNLFNPQRGDEMTTIASRKTTVNAELAKLEQAHAKAHAKVCEARDKKNAWEAEVPGLQARCASLDPTSTEAEAIKQEINARIQSVYHGAGSLRAEYAAAFAPYAELDEQLEQFRRDRCRDRIAEKVVEVDEAIEKLREGWRLIAEGAAHYQLVANAVQHIANETPGLRRKPHMVGLDTRPAEWALRASDVIDGDIVRPGLTAYGEAELG